MPPVSTSSNLQVGDNWPQEKVPGCGLYPLTGSFAAQRKVRQQADAHTHLIWGNRQEEEVTFPFLLKVSSVWSTQVESCSDLPRGAGCSSAAGWPGLEEHFPVDAPRPNPGELSIMCTQEQARENRGNELTGAGAGITHRR